MSVRDGMTLDEIWARSEAIDHYLYEPDVQARFLARLRTALNDPTYRTRYGFDWSRFACEFPTPEFDPSLEKWEIFLAMRRFAPPDQHEPPRSRVWWAVRAVVEAEDPLQWLLDQKAAGRKWPEVARQLGCGINNLDISRFVYLERKKKRQAMAAAEDSEG